MNKLWVIFTICVYLCCKFFLKKRVVKTKELLESTKIFINHKMHHLVLKWKELIVTLEDYIEYPVEYSFAIPELKKRIRKVYIQLINRHIPIEPDWEERMRDLGIYNWEE